MIKALKIALLFCKIAIPAVHFASLVYGCVVLCTCACAHACKPPWRQRMMSLKDYPQRSTILFGGAERRGRSWAWAPSRRCCSVCRNVLYWARQLHTLGAWSHSWFTVSSEAQHIFTSEVTDTWTHSQKQRRAFSFWRRIRSRALKVELSPKPVPSSVVHPPSFRGSLIVMATASFPDYANRARTRQCAQKCGNLATGLERQITVLGRWWATMPRLRSDSLVWCHPPRLCFEPKGGATPYSS